MRADLISQQLLSVAGESLSLTTFSEERGQVLEGILTAADGSWFPILEGVPCFLRGSMRPSLQAFCAAHGLPKPADEPGTAVQREQKQTNVTFSDKWRRFRNYGFEPSHQQFLHGWYVKKLGLKDEGELKAFYRDRKNILEVGPGSGFNSRFMAENTRGRVFCADISEAAHTVFENTREVPNLHVVQADLMDLPFRDGFFDFVIADGVLHHTPDTRAALGAIYRKLAPGGQMFFYVYRKMGAARQFCDQYIREHFSALEPEACYEACEGLTRLGQALSKLKASITLEKGVEVLGIPAGTHDVQRLFYYNFVKCFWNDAFDFETNNMVNFDWYHPHNAWQHDEPEVVRWLADLGVRDYAFHPANPNGISVLLRKPA